MNKKDYHVRIDGTTPFIIAAKNEKDVISRIREKHHILFKTNFYKYAGVYKCRRKITVSEWKPSITVKDMIKQLKKLPPNHLVVTEGTGVAKSVITDGKYAWMASSKYPGNPH